jgi:hypothetical protein
MSPSFDLGRVMRQVHFAFRREGAAWTGGHSSYAVRFDGALGVEPVSEEVRGASFVVQTQSIKRGGLELLSTASRDAELAATGSLTVDLGGATELIENREEGVEQSWRFASPPAGAGDLVVRVGVSGQRYTGTTEHGLHFSDPKTGLGVRYGVPRWVDGEGRETVLKAVCSKGSIQIRVPAAVLESSIFPAVLDPTVSPEFGMDQPIVGPARFDQDAPRVEYGDGSYLVVWEDLRADADNTSQQDIFGARVSPDGTLLDPTGIPIATGPQYQQLPDLAFDGANWFVVWHDVGVYGARISAGGVVLDAPPILIESQVTGRPAVAYGASEYLVVLPKELPSPALVGRRVTTAGVVQPLSVGIHAGSTPRTGVGFNGTNFLVICQDPAQATQGVWAKRVAPGGTVLDTNRITLSSGAFDSSYSPRVASDGNNWLVGLVSGNQALVRGIAADGTLMGSYVFLGVSFRGVDVAFGGGAYTASFLALNQAGASYVVRAARISTAGAIAAGPVTVSADIGGTPFDHGASLAYDGTNFLVAYSKRQELNWDIAGTIIDPALTPLGSQVISQAAERQEQPAVAFNGTNYLVAWAASKVGTYTTRVVGTRVDSTGSVLDPSGLSIAEGIELGSEAGKPALASNGTDWVAAWSGYEASDYPIYARRVLANGSLPEPATLLTTHADWWERNVAAASDGADYLIVSSGSSLRGSRFSASGTHLGTQTISESVGGAPPAVAFNGTNYLVAWAEDSTFMQLARVSPAGAVLGTTSRSGSSLSSWPTLASNGVDWFLAWDTPCCPHTIRSARITAAGNASDGPLIAEGAGAKVVSRPSAAWDGTQYLVAWYDERAQAAYFGDIYGARVQTDGTLSDPTGFPIATEPENEAFPALARGPGGQVLVTYQRFDPKAPYGSDRIRGRFVSDLLPSGDDCTQGTQCASGHCGQGVCCDDECTGACESCLGAHTSEEDGTCAPVAVGTDPKSLCADEGASSCGTTGVCNATGSCALYPASTPCGSPVCDGTLLKDQSCDGSGACVPEAEGDDCAPFTCSSGACDDPCGGDSECVAGYFCSSGSCVPKGGKGASCDDGDECAEGHCVDGVCCESACDGGCEACSTLVKGAGDDGECEPVAAGGDPDDDCSEQAPETCGRTGACDGSGECQLRAAGVSCGSSVCDVSTAKGQICDGEGACIASETGVDCAPYACAGGACQNPCTAPSDCLAGYVCVSSTCVLPGSTGAPCSNGSECGTGSCVDGVCCDDACSGTCLACSAEKKGQGADGECGPIVAAQDPDGECAAEDESTCGLNGQCNGAGACARWVEGTECAAGACSGTTETAPSTCDADGQCLAGIETECDAGYRCDGAVCVAVPDGAAGAGGEGGAPASSGEGGEGGSTGGTTAAGEGGEAEIPKSTPSASSEEGGCGCRSVRGKPNQSAWLLAASAVLLARARRRRAVPITTPVRA